MPLPENIIILFYWTAPQAVFFIAHEAVSYTHIPLYGRRSAFHGLGDPAPTFFSGRCKHRHL